MRRRAGDQESLPADPFGSGASRGLSFRFFLAILNDCRGRKLHPDRDEVMRGVAAAVVTAILIGALYFGREVFVPIALAILLSFVLAPLVGMLQRWHFPRALSVISVVVA